MDKTQFHDPTSDVIIAAFNSLGVPRNDDFNGDDQWGVGYFDANIKGGKRWSAAMAYLRPTEKRTNLTIFTDAHVKVINFEGKRATGVQYSDKSGDHALTAQRETILSAGAYHSPQLLQLSGIGHADHLRSLGIKVLVDRS